MIIDYNTYEYEFYSTCPNNKEPIKYYLTIISEDIIYVEEIIELCNSFKENYHEEIADKLFEALGENQMLIANHHGVTITTYREEIYD